MRGLLKALGAGVMAAALSATGASAQDAMSQARSYLENGMAVHGERGYERERTIPDLIRPFELEGAFLWPVFLRRGVNYRVYAACDNDCSDVDMEIYGADGALVDRDVAADDTPYVQITPTETARHYVRLWVYACSTEPCYVAARVLAGGRPGERAPEVLPDGDGELSGGGWEEVVRGELDAAGSAHLSGGYALFGEEIVTPITLEGGGYTQNVRLEGGRSYIFQGACDQDCSDVDMEILDPNGQRAAADEAADDRPVLRLRAPRTGDYTLRIWLASCTQEPCYVGVRGYSRR